MKLYCLNGGVLVLSNFWLLKSTINYYIYYMAYSSTYPFLFLLYTPTHPFDVLTFLHVPLCDCVLSRTTNVHIVKYSNRGQLYIMECPLRLELNVVVNCNDEELGFLPRTQKRLTLVLGLGACKGIL